MGLNAFKIAGTQPIKLISDHIIYYVVCNLCDYMTMHGCLFLVESDRNFIIWSPPNLLLSK